MLIWLGYVFLLLVSVWGIQFYINLFKHPVYLLIPLVLAVFIPMSIIFLVPLDYVQHNSELSFSLLDTVILYLWKSKYWITFLLTWLVLPVLQEFFKSGQYKNGRRIVDALKKNLRFQLVVIAVSILGAIYLALEVGLSFGHMKLMIIALSHIYALVLALWLMAHGLVNIPRDKWTFGSVVGKLNFLYLKVPKLIDELEDCKISFKEDILQVLVLQKNYTRDIEDFEYRDWILDLYVNIPEDLKELMELQYLNEAPVISRDQLTSNFMIKLSAKFKANLHKLVAYEAAFNTMFREIVLLEDVLNAGAVPEFRLETPRLISPRTKYIYHYYINPILNRISAIALFAVSFVIIESELFHSTRLSLMNVIFKKLNPTLQFLFCCGAFSIMLVCLLNSLTKLRIFNMFHLVPHKSDPVSACFYATYIARLTIPLSYNFVTLFVLRKSIFEDWFGKSIHLTGLFNLMNNWIPRLVLLPIILTVFNVYDKLKRRLGINADLYDTFGFDEGDVESQTHKRKDMIIVEAKRIIAREYTRRKSAPSRQFNMEQAADLNYHENRRNFSDQLSNRIDAEDILDHPNQEGNGESIWSRLGTQISGFRDQVSTRFGRSRGSLIGYEDEPLTQLENFDYDEDADHELML